MMDQLAQQALQAFLKSFGMNPETLKNAALEAVQEIQKFKAQIDGMDGKLDKIDARLIMMQTQADMQPVSNLDLADDLLVAGTTIDYSKYGVQSVDPATIIGLSRLAGRH
jgi:hypothetical protein